MNSHPCKGAFEPEDLNSLQRIYDEITSQRWFPACPEARTTFARYLFAKFPGPTYDARRHRSAIEASVRLAYATEDPH